MADKKHITILLADDDKDDRFFFTKALKKLPLNATLVTLEDGEMLLNYLSEKQDNFPDILFLDVNMPCKNGLECLTEIKANKKITDFPIIIYSTALSEPVADVFYQEGAHSYLKKCEFNTLVQCLNSILTKLENGDFIKEAREHFIFSLDRQ